MSVVKIRLYQNLCNYRKEGSFGYVQTYPLPTPSMIRGWIHDVLELNEYKQVKISIQGKSDTVVTNTQKVYKFDRDPKSRPQNPYIVKIGESTKTALQGISFVDLHVNMKLILHICFDNDENLCKELYQRVQEKVPVLGRNEDLALIEDVKIVNIKNVSSRSTHSKLPMYVSQDALIENVGTRYRLPFWYEKVDSFKENRFFHFIDVNYIGEDVPLRRDNIFIDDEDDIVCLLMAP